MFLQQNLDVLIAKYGIEHSKGQEITAKLFPNPVMSIGTLSSFTQGLTPASSGQLFIQAQQLFELAGKRGYRIESAGFGIQSTEASFEDAIRQLFAQHGQVHSVALIMDRETGRPRGFGFVEMDDDAATAAIKALNGHSMDGRNLKVSEATERPRR